MVEFIVILCFLLFMIGSMVLAYFLSKRPDYTDHDFQVWAFGRYFNGNIVKHDIEDMWNSRHAELMMPDYKHSKRKNLKKMWKYWKEQKH